MEEGEMNKRGGNSAEMNKKREHVQPFRMIKVEWHVIYQRASSHVVPKRIVTGFYICLQKTPVPIPAWLVICRVSTHISCHFYLLGLMAALMSGWHAYGLSFWFLCVKWQRIYRASRFIWAAIFGDTHRTPAHISNHNFNLTRNGSSYVEMAAHMWDIHA